MLTGDHFASEYEAAIADHPVGESGYVYAADGAGARAVAIEVEPWGEPAWLATFAAPEPGVRALTALLGTPASTGLCVVERGTAFLGDVLDPAGFIVVETPGPVVGAEELVLDGLLLLLSPWSIVAVGDEGVRWTTERIAIDGLRIDASDGGWVRGVADPNDDEPRVFSVELASGRVVGGTGVA